MDGVYASNRLRLGRVSETGRVYHVRFSVRPGSHLIHALPIARHVIDALRSGSPDALTLCFVVMPDHVHWLFELRGDDLSSIVQKVKSCAARTIRSEPGWHSFSWRSGFFDRALRNDEELLSTARYIVANPLRAGLVNSLRDYPHWDAIWLE
ncbi:MAG: transposase [Halothiobacillaceae bacterium]|nr:transposase [Halothiobacillaceae bacterium]HER19503.1 transposase [Chromatiales bacterium]